MLRIAILVMILASIASFPFVSNYLAKDKVDIMHGQGYINDLISDYIETHPAQIMSSLRKYSMDMEEDARHSFVTAAIETNKDKLYNTDSPVVGDGDAVQVVEFFDYACSYCKNIGAQISDIIEDNHSNIRYMFREVAILGNGASSSVARAALAVNMMDKGKYFDFHKEALAYEGDYTDDAIKGIVRNIGLDLDQFEKIWNGEKTRDLLQGNIDLFHSLGIGGIPSFIVCGKPIIGANIDALKMAIKDCDKNI